MKFKNDNQRAQNHVGLTENQGLEIVLIAIKQEILVFLVGHLEYMCRIEVGVCIHGPTHYILLKKISCLQ